MPSFIQALQQLGNFEIFLTMGEILVAQNLVKAKQN